MTSIETFTTEGLLQPPAFDVPREYIEDIKALRNLEAEELPDVITQGILYKTLEYAKSIRDSDFYTKPDILVSKHTTIQRPNNCTDDASIQIRLLKAAGIPSFAKFNTGHASVIVQDYSDFWQLDDDSSVGVKKSTVLDPHTDGEKIQATSKALCTIGQSAGFYIYRDKQYLWQTKQIIDDKGVRNSSPYYLDEEIIDGATVLVKPPFGLHMLNAIDVLDSINSNDISSEASIAKTFLRSRLVQFVPKLRSSQS